jgi:ribosome-associated translation inhibitor RaiA
MKIQVNTDKTIAVDASLIRFVEGEVGRVLSRFAIRLTRVEIHLSDVDNRKVGQTDKRCLIEVRPAGARPLNASAQATKMAYAVSHALGKMQRSLTTFFGRRGRSVAAVSTPVLRGKMAVARKATLATKKAAEVEKVVVEQPTKLSPRDPKKKGIYQARRKSWPTR